MKNLGLIIFGILLVMIGIYVTGLPTQKAKVSVWKFIPSNSAAVMELIPEKYSTIPDLSIWKVLEKSPAASGLNHAFDFIDSISNNKGVKHLFDGSPLVLVFTKTDEVLFLLDMYSESKKATLTLIEDKIKKQNKSITNLTVNGMNFNQLEWSENVSLYYTIENSFLLVGNTKEILANSVKIARDTSTSHQTFLETPLLANAYSYGTLYIDFKQLEESTSIFSKFYLHPNKGAYNLFFNQSVVDFSGFTNLNTDNLAQHRSKPATSNILKVIPTETSHFFHISSQDLNQWITSQTKLSAKRWFKSKSIQDSIDYQFNITIDEALQFATEEMSLVFLNKKSSQKENEKLFIIKTNDIDETINFYKEKTGLISVEKDGQIEKFSISNLTEAFLGELGTGFENTFYTTFQNFLILGSDRKTLNIFFNSLNSESTWGKNLKTSKFLDAISQSANLSIFFDGDKLISNASENFFESLFDHCLGVIQFNYIHGRNISNFTFTQPQFEDIEPPIIVQKEKDNVPPPPTPASSQQPRNSNDLIQLNKQITTKPFLLRTHKYRDYDLMVQDQNNTLHFFEKRKKKKWSKKLDAPITTSIELIDFYNNNKIQYVFGTSKSLYIIDRDGNFLPNFPTKMSSDKSIEKINIFDYENNGDIRLAIHDSGGNVFLLDKKRASRIGWSPKSFTSKKANDVLEYYRINKKDVMLLVTNDGVIHAMNRNGTYLSGFKYSVGKVVGGDYFFNQGATLEESIISVITESGELHKVNLLGKQISKTNLSNKKEGKSLLVKGIRKKSHLFAHSTNNSIEIYSAPNRKLFDIKQKLSENIKFQYYDLGGNLDRLFVTDFTNRQLWVYSLSGALRNKVNLDSDSQVSVLYSNKNKSYNIYVSFGASVRKYTIK